MQLVVTKKRVPEVSRQLHDGKAPGDKEGPGQYLGNVLLIELQGRYQRMLQMVQSLCNWKWATRKKESSLQQHNAGSPFERIRHKYCGSIHKGGLRKQIHFGGVRLLQ